MKKLSMFLLAASLFGFVACGGSQESAEEATESTETTVNEAEKAVEQPAAPAATDTAMATDTAAAK